MQLRRLLFVALFWALLTSTRVLPAQILPVSYPVVGKSQTLLGATSANSAASPRSAPADDSGAADDSRAADDSGSADETGEPAGPFIFAEQAAALQGETIRGFGTTGEPTGGSGPSLFQNTPSGRFFNYGGDTTRGFGTVGEVETPTRGDDFGTIHIKQRPYKPNMSAEKREVEWEFEDGLTAHSKDGYFSLTFHNLTQVDYRGFNPTGDPLHNNFFIPRQRWYFIGNVSPYVNYYTVVNRGYNSIDLLDAFADLNTGIIEKEKFKVRVGRMKTPYTYEYIKISENDLIAPERSVFVGNFAPNREEGFMAHGQVAEKRLEYAVGLFNGPRRSFGDFNSSKDLFTFINFKPFLLTDCELLKQLNVGGSYNVGNEHNPTQPGVLRTASDQSPGTTANMVSPTFYTFSPKVFENGMRMQYSADLMYYYKSLGIMAAYQGGFQDYGTSATAIPSNFVGVTSVNQTHVQLSGWNVTTFYFLTGEEVTRRSFLLEPRSAFDGSWRRGNLGAFELFGRFANLAMSDNSQSLADPTLASANRANVTDLGINWYTSHYTKLTLDWQYGAYNNPIQISPGRTTMHTNLFWFRAQVFF